MAEEHFYYSVNMHGLEVRNHRMHLLASDPVAPNEGDLWWNTTDHVARVRNLTENRDLFSPDDDFYSRLTEKTAIVDGDIVLIADSEDTFNYKWMTKANLVLGLGLVQNAYYRVSVQSGDTDLDATGEDDLSIVGDGDVYETVGAAGTVNTITLTLLDQNANLVFAGPSSGGATTPTFRALVDNDMPSSYTPVNWDAAYTHSLVTSGNPHGIDMLDLGYTVVITISDPGSDSNLVTEQGIKEYVDNLVLPVTYYGSVITTNDGDYVSGDINSISAIDDADVYEVDEVTGVPGFDITVDFVAVDQIANKIVTHVWYSGAAGHTVQLQLWNYTGTPQWDTITTITESTDYIWVEEDITNPSDYIDGSNEAQMRFYHLTSGNPVHDIKIDYAVLKYVPAGGGGGVTDHGSLSGLQDDDHKIYALLDGRLNDILLIDEIDEFTLNSDITIGQVLTVDQENARVGVGVPAPIHDLDVAGSGRFGSGLTGQSTIGAGLVVNLNSGSLAISDFEVRTATYNALYVDASDDSVLVMSNPLGKAGFFGEVPTVQSTGWTITNHVLDKVLDANATTINEICDVLGELITELKLKGILGG